MQIENHKAIHTALARAVASRDISKEAVSKASEKLSTLPSLKRLDICAYGICLDLLIPERELGDQLTKILRNDKFEMGEIRIFKYGIISPEWFHVHAEVNIPEVQGQAPRERF